MLLNGNCVVGVTSKYWFSNNKLTLLVFALISSHLLISQGDDDLLIPVLEQELSSEYWELSVSMSPQMNKVVTTYYPPSVLFFGTKTKDVWSYQVLPFSGEYDDSGGDLSLDGEKIYFSSNRPTKGSNINSSSDLWVSNFRNGKWQLPVHLGNLLNSKEDELSPSISKNGNLYFMKSGPESFGGYDIFVSRMVDGKYQKPINLGENINSSSNEEDPYIDPEERFIIFMSQRRGDYTSPCNLFISIKDDVGWSKAVPLSTLFGNNSCMYSPFVAADNNLYFLSYGEGIIKSDKRISYAELKHLYNSPGNGSGDIYSVPLDKLIELMKIEL